MGIDKDQMYVLIAQRPKIRTVEIADIIDCEPDQVEPALAQEIQRGDIIVHKVTAPNGRPANGFEFSGAFKQSDVYSAIARTAGVTEVSHGDEVPVTRSPLAAAAEAAEAADVAALAKAGAPSDVRTTSPSRHAKVPRGIQWREDGALPKPKATPRLTYPDRAIAFIRANGGRADNETLRVELGLGVGASPTSYLRIAVVGGRLARAGRDWILGPNADVPSRHDPGKTKPRALVAPVAAELPAPTMAGADAEVSTGAAAPASFRCAKWSDGILELQRDGKTIAELAPAEQAVLASFQMSAA